MKWVKVTATTQKEFVREVEGYNIRWHTWDTDMYVTFKCLYAENRFYSNEQVYWCNQWSIVEGTGYWEKQIKNNKIYITKE